MANLSALGHFFGFTSTINYATSIFGEFSNFFYSLVSQFGVEKLSKEKVLYEQNHPIYEELYNHAIVKTSDVKRKKKLIKNKANLAKHLMKMQLAEVEAESFLQNIKNNEVYKYNLKRRYKPLFPLAGTFSVIFLLFAAFNDANEYDHIICFNTVLFLDIAMVFLCLMNFTNFFGLPIFKNYNVESRTLFLNVMLVILTFISWIFAYLIDAHPNWAVGKITDFWTRVLFIFSFCIASIGFIAFALRIIRVNNAAITRTTKFSKSNRLYKAFLTNNKP